VPDKPGLGFDGINEDYLREHIDPERPGIFEPTETWDTDRSNDRLWS
jgi:gluconate/galactonate dehydratase